MPLPQGEAEQAYAPYDPTDVNPDLAPVEPVTTTETIDEALEDLPSFDERYIEEFNGLMYLGALVKTFEWVGHTFTIRTLMSDDYLAVGVLTKDYAGTIAEGRAYTTAVVAMALQSVDGQPLPTPVGSHDSTYAWAFQRFNWVKARLFPPVVDTVYGEFLVLEAKAKRVLDAMGKASGWEPSTLGSNGSAESQSVEDFSASPA